MPGWKNPRKAASSDRAGRIATTGASSGAVLLSVSVLLSCCCCWKFGRILESENRASVTDVPLARPARSEVWLVGKSDGWKLDGMSACPRSPPVRIGTLVVAAARITRARGAATILIKGKDYVGGHMEVA